MFSAEHFKLQGRSVCFGAIMHTHKGSNKKRQWGSCHDSKHSKCINILISGNSMHAPKNGAKKKTPKAEASFGNTPSHIWE